MTRSTWLAPRRLVGAALASVAALAVVAATAAPAQADPPEDAAAYLVTQLTDGDHVEMGGFVQYGPTIDVGLGLRAAESEPDSLDAIASFMTTEDALFNYLHGGGFDRPDAAYAGATGKLGFFVSITGGDPRDVAGEDLIDTLLSLEGKDGRFTDRSDFGDFSNVLGQSLGILSLTAAEGVEPSEAAVQVLLDAQCDDGGYTLAFDGGDCAGTPDATGVAVQALNANDPGESERSHARAGGGAGRCRPLARGPPRGRRLVPARRRAEREHHRVRRARRARGRPRRHHVDRLAGQRATARRWPADGARRRRRCVRDRAGAPGARRGLVPVARPGRRRSGHRRTRRSRPDADPDRDADRPRPPHRRHRTRRCRRPVPGRRRSPSPRSRLGVVRPLVLVARRLAGRCTGREPSGTASAGRPRRSRARRGALAAAIGCCGATSRSASAWASPPAAATRSRWRSPRDDRPSAAARTRPGVSVVVDFGPYGGIDVACAPGRGHRPGCAGRQPGSTGPARRRTGTSSAGSTASPPPRTTRASGRRRPPRTGPTGTPSAAAPGRTAPRAPRCSTRVPGTVEGWSFGAGDPPGTAPPAPPCHRRLRHLRRHHPHRRRRRRQPGPTPTRATRTRRPPRPVRRSRRRRQRPTTERRRADHATGCVRPPRPNAPDDETVQRRRRRLGPRPRRAAGHRSAPCSGWSPRRRSPPRAA